MVQTKYKILILFWILLVILRCAHKGSIIKETPEIKIAPKPTPVYAKNSIFFVSSQQTEGDVWLYDFEKNSLWQITFLDDSELEICGVSPDNRFIVITYNEGKGYVIESEYNDLIPIRDSIYESELKSINNICWISNDMFLCIGSNENFDSKIFRVFRTKDEKWIFEPFEIPLINIALTTERIALSHNRKYLAILTKELELEKILYVYNFDTADLKKLGMISQSNVKLIWNEENNAIFYNHKNAIFQIDFKGFNKVIVSEQKKISNIYQNSETRYKIYYTIESNGEVSLYLKDTDRLGPGQILKRIKNLKDIYFCAGKLFYDTLDNEVHSLNLETLEDNLLFSDSALFYLIENE